MTIELGPELASLVTSMAQKQGKTPEGLALEILAERVQVPVSNTPRMSHEEFKRRLAAIGKPCGVSLSDEQLSRETMYD